jgi:hypothetical protein
MYYYDDLGARLKHVLPSLGDATSLKEPFGAGPRNVYSFIDGTSVHHFVEQRHVHPWASASARIRDGDDGRPA